MYEARNEKTQPLPMDKAIEEYGQNIRRAFTYRAFNRLIQGSAADMTKQAMLDLWKEGIVPHIQVHDELDISVKNKEESRKIVEIMETCVDLNAQSFLDRNRNMWDAYKKGKTMEQIGDEYGLTKQRVHQIIRRCKLGDGDYYVAHQMEKDMIDHSDYTDWLKNKGVKTIKRNF